MRLLNLFVLFLSKRFLACLPVLLVMMIAGSAALCGAQTVKLADADPELRDALLHDAQCPAAGTASNDADHAALLQTPFSTQTLHKGGVIGVVRRDRKST